MLIDVLATASRLKAATPQFWTETRRYDTSTYERTHVEVLRNRVYGRLSKCVCKSKRINVDKHALKRIKTRSKHYESQRSQMPNFFGWVKFLQKITDFLPPPCCCAAAAQRSGAPRQPSKAPRAELLLAPQESLAHLDSCSILCLLSEDAQTGRRAYRKQQRGSIRAVLVILTAP